MSEKGTLTLGEHMDNVQQWRATLLSFYAGLHALIEKGEPTVAISISTEGTEPIAQSYAEEAVAYDTLGTSDKAAFLVENNNSMPISAFVNKGLIVGAQRMDESRAGNNLDSSHAEIVSEILASERAKDIFYAAQHHILDLSESRINNQPRKIAELLSDHLDPYFANPVMVYEVVGMNYHTRQYTQTYPFIDTGTQAFMRSNDWSSELQALMVAYGMHYTAIQQARRLVLPLLTQVTGVKDGLETAFWGRKVLGTDAHVGTQYYLGYIEKSRSLLRQHMQRMWGDDYHRNQQVFISAALMKTKASTLPENEKRRVRELRRPIFGAIASGDFDEGERLLRDIAEEEPHLLSWIGLEFFSDTDQPTSKNAT